MKGRVCEIFSSIQGEGLFMGRLQYFVRLSGCNLNCSYCDTDHEIHTEMEVDAVLERLNDPAIKELSITGGEPLLQAGYVSEIAEKCGKKVLLETNGTLVRELCCVLPHIDVVSMDLKPEAGMLEQQLAFADIAASKKLYFKLVIEPEKAEKAAEYALNFNDFNRCALILTPETSTLEQSIKSCLNIFHGLSKEFRDIRIIPQVHRLAGLK